MEINNWYKLTFKIETNLEEIIIWKLNELGIFSFAFEILLNIGSVEILISVFNSIFKMYQLAGKLSFIYSDAQCGYVGIGRQAWLRAKWGIPVTVRVCLAAPS